MRTAEGFKIVYEKSFENPFKSFILVEVPLVEPVAVRYTKPRLGLDFTVTPLSRSAWELDGTVDPDIIEHFGLPVTTHRYRRNPPVITPEDLLELQRRMGASVEQIREDWYRLNMRLNTSKVVRFFDKIWARAHRPEPVNGVTPRIDLAELRGNHRILPEKTVVTTGVEMVVKRH